MPVVPLILFAALQAAPACTTPVAPPPELAGWAAASPVTAGTAPAKAPALTIGRGTRTTLAPTPRITYPAAPEKPGAATSYGGVFSFAVTAPGRYRVALGAGAWLDVVQGGEALASVAHAHGPACSGIRKMVDFDLAPGRYLLQVAGAEAPALSLMVARFPR